MALAGVLLAACSSSPSSSKKTTTTTTTTSSSSSKLTQSMTVSPSSGLHSGETVNVKAKGFSPNEALVVIECAKKGNATQAGDCNLNGLKSVTSTSSGSVSATFNVQKGPFGTKKIVCSSANACIVSVSQATESPTQDATANISFG